MDCRVTRFLKEGPAHIRHRLQSVEGDANGWGHGMVMLVLPQCFLVYQKLDATVEDHMGAVMMKCKLDLVVATA